MTDFFQCLKLTTIKEMFPLELQYIKDHVWDYARTNSAVLLLLNDDKLSLHHLEAIHRQMEADKVAIAKRLEEEQRMQRRQGEVTCDIDCIEQGLAVSVSSFDYPKLSR
jgi:hypothetical protein